MLGTMRSIDHDPKGVGERSFEANLEDLSLIPHEALVAPTSPGESGPPRGTHVLGVAVVVERRPSWNRTGRTRDKPHVDVVGHLLPAERPELFEEEGAVTTVGQASKTKPSRRCTRARRRPACRRARARRPGSPAPRADGRREPSRSCRSPPRKGPVVLTGILQSLSPGELTPGSLHKTGCNHTPAGFITVQAGREREPTHARHRGYRIQVVSEPLASRRRRSARGSAATASPPPPHRRGLPALQRPRRRDGAPPPRPLRQRRVDRRAAKMVRASEEGSATLNGAEGDPWQVAARRVMDAITAFDARAVGRLETAQYRRGHERVRPGLRPGDAPRGRALHAGSLSIAQEHIATQAVGDVVRGMMRLTNPEPATHTVLLGCVADESHTSSRSTAWRCASRRGASRTSTSARARRRRRSPTRCSRSSPRLSGSRSPSPDVAAAQAAVRVRRGLRRHPWFVGAAAASVADAVRRRRRHGDGRRFRRRA